MLHRIPVAWRFAMIAAAAVSALAIAVTLYLPGTSPRKLLWAGLFAGMYAGLLTMAATVLIARRWNLPPGGSPPPFARAVLAAGPLLLGACVCATVYLALELPDWPFITYAMSGISWILLLAFLALGTVVVVAVWRVERRRERSRTRVAGGFVARAVLADDYVPRRAMHDTEDPSRQ